MKYRLKNREFQAQLDRLSRGDFSRRLDEWNGDRSQELVNFSFGEETGHDSFPRTFETAIRTADIEEVPTYDPSTWNEWPNVIPPEGVDMRVEVLSKDGEVIFKGASVFVTDAWNIGGHWYDDRRVRFRPWDDTTSTLSKKMLQEIVTALESHPEAYELGYLIDAVDEAANELPD